MKPPIGDTLLPRYSYPMLLTNSPIKGDLSMSTRLFPHVYHEAISATQHFVESSNDFLRSNVGRKA
jgi:hypothetical protein